MRGFAKNITIVSRRENAMTGVGSFGYGYNLLAKWFERQRNPNMTWEFRAFNTSKSRVRAQQGFHGSDREGLVLGAFWDLFGTNLRCPLLKRHPDLKRVQHQM